MACVSAILALPKNDPQSGIIGYYAYMAPEQNEGHPCFGSDQYALAVMVYEWLCGALPFTGTSKELTRQHKSTPPPSLCERNPNISPAVEAAVLKALSKKPEDRHGNIVQFAQALEAAALSSPPPASKPKPKPTRRWVLLALLFTTALALIDRVIESWSYPRVEVVQPHPRVATFEQQSEVETIAWSPDSKRIASSGIDGNIRIWDIATQRQTIQAYKQGSRVLAMMWLSDNKHIASLGVDGMLHIWDATSGKLNRQYRRTEISNDGVLARTQVAKWAATGDLATSLGTTALVYDVPISSGFSLPDISFAMHSSSVKALGFSPLGDMIASCDSDGIVWVWNPDNARPVLPPYQGHTSGVLSVGWQPQPKSQLQSGLIATGDLDGVVQIWHWHATSTANAGEPYASYWHNGPVHTVAWSPDGQYLVSGGADHVAMVWKTSNQSRSKYNGHLGCINVVAVAPNGKFVASGSVDETVQVWKL